MVSAVEPILGRGRPTILYDYPASQAALALVRADQVPVAERFELYVDGIELANGYHELLDPDELARRSHQANEARVADGKCALPLNSRLLDAMRHGLPACTGVALGVDRLVMVAVGAADLSQVLAFPADRA
jgi:lysyl-tRNA synthetase class 2